MPGDIEDGRRGANAEDRLEALEICAVPGRLIVDVSRGSKKELKKLRGRLPLKITSAVGVGSSLDIGQTLERSRKSTVGEHVIFVIVDAE